MIEMHFPSEGHDFFHISHERAGNDITPSLHIPELKKVPFQSRSASIPLLPGRRGTTGTEPLPPPSSTVLCSMSPPSHKTENRHASLHLQHNQFPLLLLTQIHCIVKDSPPIPSPTFISSHSRVLSEMSGNPELKQKDIS